MNTDVNIIILCLVTQVIVSSDTLKWNGRLKLLENVELKYEEEECGV